MSFNSKSRLFVQLALFSIGLGTARPGFAADPAGILAQVKTASGGLAWDSVRSLHIRANVELGGLKGVAENWDDCLTGRGYSKYSIGPVTGADGWDGQAGWTQDSSGQSKKLEGGDEIEGAVDDAYRRCLAYTYTNRWPAAIEDAGTRQEGERQFQVLKITPKGGRVFELWLDSSSWLVVRTVEKTAIETRTIHFSDYRAVDGKKVPFATRVTNGEIRYDQFITVDSIEFNVPMDESKFKMPAPPAPDFSFAAGKTSTMVPFELINNHIYVRVKFNGQGPFKVLCDTG
jgi:hypothetical protein